MEIKVICWYRYPENKVQAKLKNTRGRGRVELSRKIEKIFFMTGEEEAFCIILRWRRCWREWTRSLSTGLGPPEAGVHFLVWGKETLRGTVHCFLPSNED